jgi:hypothetical protein
MILAKTYLMNSTKEEYIYIGADYPDKLGSCLLQLEKFSNWDLRLDNIFIKHSFTTHEYTDVKDKIYNKY